MNEKSFYDKEINCIIDIEKKIECVNLSLGANNLEDFKWIINNLSVFKEESALIYEKVLMDYLNQEKKDLYIIVQEEKDFAFTAVEKHLGIWKKYKDFQIEDKSKDFFLKDNHRYAYALLNGFKVENMPMFRNGIFIAVNKYNKIYENIDIGNFKNIFEYLYNEGDLIFVFRDLWTEGNSLVFYSSNVHERERIVNISKDNGFTMINMLLF